MTNASTRHQYQIGDTVLATIGEDQIQVPGVIEAYEDGRFQICLSQAWVDNQSQQVQDVWLSPEQLAPYIDQETGGVDALPG